MARLPGTYPNIQDGGLGMIADAAEGQRALIGVSSRGPFNVPLSFSDPTQVVTKLGFGPLSTALVDQLSQGGGTVVGMRLEAGIAGAFEPDLNNPDEVVGITGQPLESLDLIVTITTGGEVGDAAFTYSLDGGDNVSIPFATAAVFEVPGTGVTLTFTSTDPYVAGSRYRFGVAAPQASVGDVQRGVRTLFDSPMLYEYIHLCQPSDNAVWAALSALAQEAEGQFRYIFFIAETVAPEGDPDVWVQNLLVQKETFSSKRVLLCAAYGEVADSITGQFRVQNLASRLGARLSRSKVSENPGWVQRGAIDGLIVAAPFVDTPFGKQPLYNNGHALTLDTAGFTAIHQIPSRDGYFFVDGRMASEATSDYRTVPYRRVMDKAVALVHSALVDHVQEGVDPVDLDVSLAALIADAESPLRLMAGNGEIRGGRVTIPPGQDLLASQQLRVVVRIIPLGYLREIDLDIGFENPYLYREDAR